MPRQTERVWMRVGLSHGLSQKQCGHSPGQGRMFTPHRLHNPIHSPGTVPSVLIDQKVSKLCVQVLGGDFSLRQVKLLPWNLLKEQLL